MNTNYYTLTTKKGLAFTIDQVYDHSPSGSRKTTLMNCQDWEHCFYRMNTRNGLREEPLTLVGISSYDHEFSFSYLCIP